MPTPSAGGALLSLSRRLEEKRTRTIDVFRQIDASGDGTVSAEELRRHLAAAMDLDMSNQDFSSLLERVDKDRSGEVTLKELDRAIKQAQREEPQPAAPAPRRRRQPPPPLPGGLITQRLVPSDSKSSRDFVPAQEHLEPMTPADEALVKVKGHLNKLKKRMMDIYRIFDTDGTGVVSADEFRQGIAKLGVQLKDEEFDAVVAGVDKDGSGEIEIKEFARALKLAERKARADGRDAEVDTWWVTAPPREALGVRPEYDWGNRSVVGSGLGDFSLSLTASSWVSAAAGPKHASMSTRIHCGSLQDSSVGRLRLFDGVTARAVPPTTESPRLPTYKTVHPHLAWENRFERIPVTLPSERLQRTKERCSAAARGLRVLMLPRGTRRFEHTPSTQDHIDPVMGKGEAPLDPGCVAMYDSSAGVPSWRRAG